MYSTFLLAGLVALAKAHGVILAAQGLPGSPASVGFQGRSTVRGQVPRVANTGKLMPLWHVTAQALVLANKIQPLSVTRRSRQILSTNVAVQN
jgi:hypothetical protein